METVIAKDLYRAIPSRGAIHLASMSLLLLPPFFLFFYRVSGESETGGRYLQPTPLGCIVLSELSVQTNSTFVSSRRLPYKKQVNYNRPSIFHLSSTLIRIFHLDFYLVLPVICVRNN